MITYSISIVFDRHATERRFMGKHDGGDWYWEVTRLFHGRPETAIADGYADSCEQARKAAGAAIPTDAPFTVAVTS